jgi:hypothetical protein
MRTNKAVEAWQNFFDMQALNQSNTISTFYESEISSTQFQYTRHRRKQNEIKWRENILFQNKNDTTQVSDPHDISTIKKLASIIKQGQFADKIFDDPRIEIYLNALYKNGLSLDMHAFLKMYVKIRNEFGDQVKVFKKIDVNKNSQFVYDFLVRIAPDPENPIYTDKSTLARFKKLAQCIPNEENFAIKIYTGNFPEGSFGKTIYDKINEPFMPRHQEVILLSPRIWHAMGLALYGHYYFHPQPILKKLDPLTRYTHQKTLNAKLISLVDDEESTISKGLVLFDELFSTLEASGVNVVIRNALFDVLGYIKKNYQNNLEILSAVDEMINLSISIKPVHLNKNNSLLHYFDKTTSLENPLGAALFIAAVERKCDDNSTKELQYIRRILDERNIKWGITSILVSTWFKESSYKIKVLVLYMRFILKQSVANDVIFNKLFSLIKQLDHNLIEVEGINYKFPHTQGVFELALDELNRADIERFIGFLLNANNIANEDIQDDYYQLARNLSDINAQSFINLSLDKPEYQNNAKIIADLIRMTIAICPNNRDFLFEKIKMFNYDDNFLLEVSILSSTIDLIVNLAPDDIVLGIFQLNVEHKISFDQSIAFLKKSGLIFETRIINVLALMADQLPDHYIQLVIDLVMERFTSQAVAESAFLDVSDPYSLKLNFALKVLSSIFINKKNFKINLNTFFSNPFVRLYIKHNREKGEHLYFYTLLQNGVKSANSTHLIDILLNHKELFTRTSPEQDRTQLINIVEATMTYHLTLRNRVNLKPLLSYLNKQYPGWIKHETARKLRDQVVNFINDTTNDPRRVNQLFWMQLPEHPRFTQALEDSPYQECRDYYSEKTGCYFQRRSGLCMR